MAKRAQEQADPRPTVSDLRKVLASRIAGQAQAAGEHPTGIPGLTLFQRTAPSPCYRATYEPSLTVFVQGRKLINLGGTEYLCDGSSFLLSSIDVPVQSQIVEASEGVPLLSMLLRLDMPMVGEVLGREDLPEPEAASHRHGLAVGETTAGLLGACIRLIEILDAPEDIPFLSALVQREIIYRILRTPQGERLRAIATRGDLSHRTAKAITWLRANYTEAATHGGTGRSRSNGRLDAAPSVPRANGDEPTSISKTAEATGSAAADDHGWPRCDERGV